MQNMVLVLLVLILASCTTSPQKHEETLDSSDLITSEEIETLKESIAHCWDIPGNTVQGDDLVVDIRIVVNPDRTVQSANIIETERYNTDKLYTDVAESARRGLLKCKSLALPPEKYHIWKEMTVRFNPREIFYEEPSGN